MQRVQLESGKEVRNGTALQKNQGQFNAQKTRALDCEPSSLPC